MRPAVRRENVLDRKLEQRAELIHDPFSRRRPEPGQSILTTSFPCVWPVPIASSASVISANG
jgi:hypothetical protein